MMNWYNCHAMYDIWHFVCYCAHLVGCPCLLKITRLWFVHIMVWPNVKILSWIWYNKIIEQLCPKVIIKKFVKCEMVRLHDGINQLPIFFQQGVAFSFTFLETLIKGWFYFSILVFVRCLCVPEPNIIKNKRDSLSEVQQLKQQ